MAQVHPPLHTIRVLTPSQHAEVQILTQLADGLSDAFDVFHSLDWTQSRPTGDCHGELDLVVVNQAGDVCMLEVKAGEVDIGPEGITKQYGKHLKDVEAQARWQFYGIQHRLREAKLDARLMHYLVLPDMQVPDSAATIRFPRDRILDANDCQSLPDMVLRKLGSGQPNELKERVCAFLLDRLTTKVDVGGLSGKQQQWTTHLAGGLAEWVPRISAPSQVIRVRATAGSGKTQLALHLLRNAAAQGLRAAYVCFNRPLADHVRRIAPDQCEVSTFHELCWEHIQRSFEQAGVSNPQSAFSFESLQQSEALYVAHMATASPDLDLLILDELQDFQSEWLQSLSNRLEWNSVRQAANDISDVKSGLYLLDDPDQCLYPDREDLAVDGEVVVDVRDNYRSPKSVVGAINALKLLPRAVHAKSPFEGSTPDFLEWPEGNHRKLVQSTADAVQGFIKEGFSLDQICVLTWRGLANSLVHALDDVGGHPVVKFTGQFNRQGEPIYSDGALRMETIRRFKGQFAPAIVITEVDFEDLDDLKRRLLFVAMTRASMALKVVMSHRALECLLEQPVE